MKSPIHLNPRITAFAEQQMRRWGQHQENVAREASFEEAGRLAAQDLSYVAISREAGAGASTIAQIVGSRLNWKVYDSNLLDEVAQRNKLPRFMLNLVDETVSNWLYNVFFPWMDSQVVSQEKFVVQVSRVIRTLSRGGNAVFVGRGAKFLLPRSKHSRCESWRRRRFATSTWKSGATSDRSKPSIRFAAPTVDAAISIGISSITISAIRICSIL